MRQELLFGSYFRYLKQKTQKIIENPIVDKILKMIAKADTDRLDFGLKTITRDHSHIVFTNETKYQNYEPRDPDSKTKIIQSQAISVWRYDWVKCPASLVGPKLRATRVKSFHSFTFQEYVKNRWDSHRNSFFLILFFVIAIIHLQHNRY